MSIVNARIELPVEIELKLRAVQRRRNIVASFGRSTPMWSGKPVRGRPNEPASRKSFTRTPCGTALPLTYSKPVQTCARSNCCWATAIWKRPRSICTSPSAISTPPRVRWMRSS